MAFRRNGLELWIPRCVAFCECVGSRRFINGQYKPKARDTMRMSPEERQELDDWAEKEYPKSIRRMEASSPFHRIGKYLIIIGILAYASFVIFDISILKPAAIIFLLAGMGMEIFALTKYFKSLSHDN